MKSRSSSSPSSSSSSPSSSDDSSDSLSAIIFKVPADDVHLTESTATSTAPRPDSCPKDDEISAIATPKNAESVEIPGSTSILPPVSVQISCDPPPPPLPAPYRIPSHVFARNNTPTSPMDWSVTSNESLFSIHMGNPSFIKEQLSLFGDLGKPGGDPPPMPTSHPQVNKISEEFEARSGDPGDNLEVAEAAAETMKGVLRVNPANQSVTGITINSNRTSLSNNAGCISPQSDDSLGSHNSFAFPILEGVEGRIRPATKTLGNEPHSQPQTQQMQQKNSESQKSAAHGYGVPARRKWFSCLTGCPYCF